MAGLEREFAAGPGGDWAAFRLVDLLVERGLVDEGPGVLWPLAEKPWARNAVWKTAELLKAAGRVDEAIEALKGYVDDCILPEFRTLLIERGRTEEGLAIIEDLAGKQGGMSEDLFRERVRLLVGGGRHEKALAELRARADAGAWYMVETHAEVLIELCRIDQAAAVLEASSPTGGRSTQPALVRILQGSVEEAVTLLTANP